VEAKVQALLETADSNTHWMNQTMWYIEINKFLEIEKGLQDGWYSNWMFQTPSKETIGTPNIFD
jgi:hypothetical protein